MNLEYFDIHSHIYFPDFDEDREHEIKKIEKANIGTITIGTGLETSKKAIELAEKHKNFFACIGQHPADLTVDSVFDEHLEKLVDHEKVVAIGETGLDYFRLPPEQSGGLITSEAVATKSIQKTVFEYHIDLAISSEKPLMLHIRSSKGTQDAYLDALDVLEHHAKIAGEKLRGNAHFFAGDMEVLKRFLKIGFTVSFTGVITFTHDYDDFVRYAPIDMIMSETDSPFVAPVPHRGKRNSPLYVPEVVKKIAEIREDDFDEVKEKLLQNALKNFGIKN